MLIVKLVSQSKNKSKILSIGSIYVTTIFITYLLVGFVLLIAIQKLKWMKPVSIIIGGLVVILGLLEIKKLFWDKAEFSLQIPSKHAKPIQEYIKKISIRSAIILGAFVAIVEIPLTGGPYLLITTLLATQGLSWGVFGLLALYNFIFVLPLLILLVGVYYGLKIVSVQQFKNKNRQWMRLAIGLIMITLGVVSMLWSLNIMRLTLS